MQNAKPKQKLTPQRAAALERQAWMRRIREDLNIVRQLSGGAAKGFLEELLAFGKSRTARVNKKPGGLGRSKKK